MIIIKIFHWLVVYMGRQSTWAIHVQITSTTKTMKALSASTEKQHTQVAIFLTFKNRRNQYSSKLTTRRQYTERMRLKSWTLRVYETSWTTSWANASTSHVTFHPHWSVLLECGHNGFWRPGRPETTCVGWQMRVYNILANKLKLIITSATRVDRYR